MHRYGPLLAACGACAVLLAGACQQGSAGPAPSPGRSGSRLAERATMSEAPTANPVRPAPKPARTPKAPQGPSLSAVYMDALTVDAQHLIAANAARLSACGGSRVNVSGCRSALQQVAAAAAALQRDLDAHPAPACLTAADTTLRSAIGLYLQGAQLGTKGLDDGSAAELGQGTTLLDQAASRLMVASGQLGQPGCAGAPPSAEP